MKTINYEH